MCGIIKSDESTSKFHEIFKCYESNYITLKAEIANEFKIIGRTKNKIESVKYYEKSAELDNELAMFTLGIMYENGEGVEQNYETAKKYFNKITDFSLKNYIGDIYYYGLIVQKNYEKAIEWFEKSAELGNEHAMFTLGIMYETGDGVAKNYEKAVERFNKITDSSLIINIWFEYLYNGFDCKKAQNHDKAIEWFEKAIKLLDNSNFDDYLRKINTFELMLKNVKMFIEILDYLKLNYGKTDTIKKFKGFIRRFKDSYGLIDMIKNTINITKDTIDDIIYLSRNIKVIARNEKYMFVKIDNSDDIRLLGCHSKWPFADNGVLKHDTRYWEKFSYRGVIYVLIHFRYTQEDPRFMTVFIQPFLNKNDKIVRYEGVMDFNSPAFNNYNINLSTVALGMLWNDFTKTLNQDQYQKVKEEVLNW